MNQARVILSLLLPALWLAASANCLVDPVGASANKQLAASISDYGHGKQDGSNAACSLEQSARRWSRRHNVQSGPDSLPTPVTLSQLDLPQLDHVEVFSVDSQSCVGLAKCWQFR